MVNQSQDDLSLGTKLLTAGTAACFADLATFPLDTAKVRMQISGEGRAILVASSEGSLLAMRTAPAGLLQTVGTIVRTEGMRSLYNGLSAGLQRQMCFASIRLGLYDTFKSYYSGIIDGKPQSGDASTLDNGSSVGFGSRILAGLTTGGLAVLFAQPTDVVKVRMQAGKSSSTSTVRYASTLQAYKHIAVNEGTRGLWKGTLPNVSRNAIINVAEIVCYDVIKEKILRSGLLEDGIPCHFSAALVAGFCATLAASPVDVVKTRYMNSKPGEYKGAIDAAVRMFQNEGPMAFYKGFVPSFSRLVSWNIALWITYEQLKIQVKRIKGVD